MARSSLFTRGRHLAWVLPAVVIAVIGAGLLAQGGNPGIQVQDGATVINPGGSDSYNFAPVGTANPKTFTVTNTGTANLLVSEAITINGVTVNRLPVPATSPCGFTLISTFYVAGAATPGVPDALLGGAPAYTIAPGQSGTFVVALNSATAGDFVASVSFATNVTATPTFTFNVSGISLEPPTVRFADDIDAQFSATGGFTAGGTATNGTVPFALTYTSAPGANAGETASYTFAVQPGQYRVSATWPGYASAASNTPFTILDGTNSLGTVTVNQQSDAAGFHDAGTNFQDLLNPADPNGYWTITGGPLVVQITDNANGVVIADCVRIQRVGYTGAIVDDNDTAAQGFATTGADWTVQPDNVNARDFQVGRHVAPPFSQTGNLDTATWTFPVPNGQYRVVVGYRGYPGYATNSPFSVYDGNPNNPALATINVDQTVTPVLMDLGVGFRNLGIFTITTGTLCVQLTNNGANGTVNADAAYIERVNVPVTYSKPDAIRFLEQATWGPTPYQINQVQSQGVAAYLQAQLTAPSSGYPTLPLYSTNNNASGAVGGVTHGNTLWSCWSDGSTNGNNFRTACTRDNYSMYPLQSQFFTNALYSNADQTRQRMAWALHKIWVISYANGGNIQNSSWMATYLNILSANEDGAGNGTFGNYRNLMGNITLNAGMGNYLNMAGSRKASGNTVPNENYPREIMQLFTIGLFELNCDGSLKMDQNGQAIPTYTDDNGSNNQFTASITEEKRVFTGWNFAPEIVLESGTSSGSNTANTFNDTSKNWKPTASGTTNYAGQFDWLTLTITGGTGSGQSKTIYTTGTNSLTLSSNWTTIPNNTSTYRITGGVADYNTPMLLNPTRAANGTVTENTTYHDFNSKILLRGFVQPARAATVANAYLDLNEALDNMYSHPNVGPFVCQNLIQQLVTSNPSPAYVARVTDVFNRRRTDPYQLQYVTAAILLDPEARGDRKTDPGYGKLKEPVLWVNNMMRMCGAVADSGTQGTQCSGYLNPFTATFNQDVFNPPTVFSYFSPEFVAVGPGPNNMPPALLGPEFQIQNTTTALNRVNFVNTPFTPNTSRAVDVVRAHGTTPSGTDPNTGNPLVPTDPNGTALYIINALLPYTSQANQPILINALNTYLLHGTMTPEMSNDIQTALTAIGNPTTLALQREVAHTALYLVFSSSQYQVQR